MSDPIDETAFAETWGMVGGDASFLAELVQTYRIDGAERIAEMRASSAAGQAPELQRAAHTLKSSSATLGARVLADRCREVEHQARDGQLTGIDAQVDAIEAEFIRVLAALDDRVGDAG